eukprot:350327-Chlamydomonas_euryale.AAC.4
MGGRPSTGVSDRSEGQGQARPATVGSSGADQGGSIGHDSRDPATTPCGRPRASAQQQGRVKHDRHTSLQQAPPPTGTTSNRHRLQQAPPPTGTASNRHNHHRHHLYPTAIG